MRTQGGGGEHEGMGRTCYNDANMMCDVDNMCKMGASKRDTLSYTRTQHRWTR